MNKEIDILMSKYYESLLETINPSFFSVNVYNDLLFISVGILFCILSLIFFFVLFKFLDKWLTDQKYIMKNRYGDSFLLYKLSDIKSEMLNRNLSLSKNSNNDELLNYKSKLKDFSKLNRLLFIKKYGLTFTVFLFIFSLSSLLYGSYYCNFIKESYLENNLSSYYNDIKNDYILENEAEIVNVSYITNYKYEDLEKEEYGSNTFKNLSTLLSNYGYYENDFSFYIFDIKTKDGKYEKLYIHDNDINVYEAKTSNESKLIKYKDYGSTFDLSNNYLFYLDYNDYSEGIKEVSIYLSESELSNYLKGKPLLIN